jgi:hypothetical protein
VKGFCLTGEFRRNPHLYTSAVVLPFLCTLLIQSTIRQGGTTSVYKGTQYLLPAKWTKQEANGVLLLSPPKTQDGEVLVVMIVESIETDTTKKALSRFANFLGGVESKTSVKSKSEIMSTMRGDLQALVQVHQLSDKDLGDYEALYEMVTDEKRDAFASVISKGEKTKSQYEDVMSSILISVRPATSAAKGVIRTGNTPDLYPGMPGWLPSGNGRAIPAAKLVNGEPVGMWYEGSVQPKSTTTTEYNLSKTIFFADGTMVRYPRFGGGMKADIEGQKAKAANAKNVGTWSISDGKMTFDVGGFHHVEKFTTGKDSAGVYFQLGSERYQPCEAVTDAFLQGSWKMASSQPRTFGANGSLTIGGSSVQGKYALDGYLLAIDNGSQYIVDAIFKLTQDAIVIGGSVYHRQ